ncbi:hypothetical protein [Companilactobacillus furfuricola]|uniref:hypothetical protein n=1 Tax=Companilactobacillus furfuricola TaxID=1462575 RepID=UPI000F781BE5|nr:hypothetical protein [Companilactobacillus furfuricola]
MKQGNFLKKWQFWLNAGGILCILLVIVALGINRNSVKNSNPQVAHSKIEKKPSNDSKSHKKSDKTKNNSKKSEQTPKDMADEMDKKFVATDYDATITYDSLARTPKEYSGKKVTYNGEVVQVMEDEKLTALRIAINGDSDTIAYCNVPTAILRDNHVLEDDQVTIFGLSSGLITYESAMGGDITIPSIIVTHIEDHGKNPY